MKKHFLDLFNATKAEEPTEPHSKKRKASDSIGYSKYPGTVKKLKFLELETFNDDLNNSWATENPTTSSQAFSLLMPELQLRMVADAKTPLNPFLQKNQLKQFIQDVLHNIESKHTLVDLQFLEGTAIYKSVGRAKIPGTSRQLNHTIPVVFVENLLRCAAETSTTPKEALKSLADTLLIFVSNKKGFALDENYINSDKFKNTKQPIEEIANRTISCDNNKTYLFSPSKKEQLCLSPNTKQKAKKDFLESNLEYTKSAINTLISKIDDANTAIIVSQIIAVQIYTLFNENDYTSFAPEGNSYAFEYRLYESEDEALNKNADYEVMTSRELKELWSNGENLDGRIRFVNCEGARVKKAPKALKLIESLLILSNHSKAINESDPKEYNTSYNKKIKLANYSGDLSLYNKELISEEFEEQVSFHIAKQLYNVLDLHALENELLVMSPNGNIKCIKSASKNTIMQCEFTRGNNFREFQKNSAKPLNSKFYRDKEIDIKILPQKLVELFITSMTPYNEFKQGILNSASNFLEEALSKLAQLAALDHEISCNELIQDTLGIYNTMCPKEVNDQMDVSYKLEVIGSDSSTNDILQEL